jgi:hypothetical protein
MWRSRGIAPPILNLCCRWGRVVKFSPGERPSGSHWVGVWRAPWSVWMLWWKGKFPAPGGGQTTIARTSRPCSSLITDIIISTSFRTRLERVGWSSGYVLCVLYCNSGRFNVFGTSCSPSSSQSKSSRAPPSPTQPRPQLWRPYQEIIG